jgi:nitroimidazol reductase NimA-like FMN-containing flavoprotein (pyridoxamine 5'-phosphate oxidase superfamily)
MRQKKKEIRDRKVILDLLKRCHVGRLGTVGQDGYPMVKPLNFVYHDRKIYFHSALSGEKIDHIKRDCRVCFEVDLPIAFVKGDENPCGAEYLYRSVIMKGTSSIVEDRKERLFALRKLMEKYQPGGGYGDFTEEKLRITGVVRIDIEEMTGKEDLGKEGMREEIKKALKQGRELPLVLERRDAE